MVELRRIFVVASIDRLIRDVVAELIAQSDRVVVVVVLAVTRLVLAF